MRVISSKTPELKIGNQWAIISSISVDQLHADVAQLGQEYVSYLPTGRGTVTMEVLAPVTPEVLKAIQGWMYGGSGVLDLPRCAEEWMCLYCGTPQALDRIKCMQCGAARNWLLG